MPGRRPPRQRDARDGLGPRPRDQRGRHPRPARGGEACRRRTGRVRLDALGRARAARPLRPDQARGRSRRAPVGIAVRDPAAVAGLRRPRHRAGGEPRGLPSRAAGRPGHRRRPDRAGPDPHGRRERGDRAVSDPGRCPGAGLRSPRTGPRDVRPVPRPPERGDRRAQAVRPPAGRPDAAGRPRRDPAAGEAAGHRGQRPRADLSGEGGSRVGVPRLPDPLDEARDRPA